MSVLILPKVSVKLIKVDLNLNLKKDKFKLLSFLYKRFAKSHQNYCVVMFDKSSTLLSFYYQYITLELLSTLVT